MMKNTYHEEIRHANHIFRLADDLSSSSMELVQMNPLSKLDVTCARARSTAEANPSLNASRLDSVHSNVRSLLRVITFMETKLKLMKLKEEEDKENKR